MFLTKTYFILAKSIPASNSMAHLFYKIRRYSRNGLSYLIGKDKVYGPPVHVHIETTNICNFRCIYCPQSQPEEHFQILGRGKMSLNMFKAILDKLTASYRIEKIILTRDGEPLVHPQLEAFVQYAHSKGTKVTIGSNGSLITEKRALKLIDSGLSILKGDFCYDRVTYERLRSGAKYEKSLTGYRNILKAARACQADFMLVLVDLNTYHLHSRKEIDDSMRKLASLFDGYHRWLDINPAIMHNALGEAKVVLSASLYKKRKPKKPHYNRCHHPWLEMVIDYRGNVVGCCRDLRSEYQAGNILEVEDVDREIWNGKRMRFLRLNLRNKTPEKINICSKYDLPYGESYAGNSKLGKIHRFLVSG